MIRGCADQRCVVRGCVAFSGALVQERERSATWLTLPVLASSAAQVRPTVRVSSDRFVPLRGSSITSAVKAPHRVRGDFDAGHREKFADHAERRTFLPQLNDAVAVRQQRCEPLRRRRREGADRFGEALRSLFRGGCVAHNAPPPRALQHRLQTEVGVGRPIYQGPRFLSWAKAVHTASRR